MSSRGVGFDDHAGFDRPRRTRPRTKDRPKHADASWEHLHRSQVCSIAKAVDRLGYSPAWTSQDAARQAVGWLAAHDAEHDLPALVGL